MGIGSNIHNRRAAVLGHPISHSLSPVLHRAAYQVLGLPWSYDAIDVSEDDLPGFLAGLDASWAGLSLTMPLKRSVLPYLDAVDPVAEQVGSVNTVVMTNGEKLGFNTDVAGIGATLKEAGAGEFPGDIVILGAGATAASALAAVVELRPRRVRICARRSSASADLEELASRLGLNAQAWPWPDTAEALSSELVISTLPGDAAAQFAQLVPAQAGLLLDMTYSPWPTSLAKSWEISGGTVAPGYRVLLWQAAIQVELMTGRQAPVTQMWGALKEAIEKDTPSSNR
jgi:shikimate dehydrogenase